MTLSSTDLEAIRNILKEEVRPILSKLDRLADRFDIPSDIPIHKLDKSDVWQDDLHLYSDDEIIKNVTKNKKTTNIRSSGWIPVEQLPTASMEVKWLCENDVEDVGFYYHPQKEFASWDLLSEKPITHWKPLEDV